MRLSRRSVLGMLGSAPAFSLAKAGQMQFDYFVGDSIPRGYGSGLGLFADQMTGGESIYPFRSIQSTLNLVCAGNAINRRFVYAGPAFGQPDDITKIARMYEAGIIKSGDAIHLCDAGPNSGDPDEYEEQWGRRLDIILGFTGITVYGWTTFDGKFTHGTPPAYDLPLYSRFNHTFGSRTINDAIKAAIAARSSVTLIDIDAGMKAFAPSPWGGHNVKLVQSDKIHYSWLGQCAAAGQILIDTGLRSGVSTVEPVLSVSDANWQTLGSSGYWPSSGSATIARSYVSAALLP